MSSPNKDNNALQVLADTASDDELRNRYDAAKHSDRSSPGSRDNYSTSPDVKEDDDFVRGSDGGISSTRKAASKAKKDGLRKGKWMVRKNMVCDCCISRMSSNAFSFHLLSTGGGGRIHYKGHPSLQFRPYYFT